MASHPLSPDIVQKALKVGDPDGISPLEATVTERLMVLSVDNMRCSLVLADPSLYDCPLIGCSDGFEALTGFSKAEVLGRNCRFLNDQHEMDPEIRQALRSAINTGIEFIGILPNRRKNGEKFRNLLHMTSISVRDHRYIIGIQADVTNAKFDLANTRHLEDLRTATERIFSANVDAWVQMQAHEFEVRLPVPYAEIVKNYVPDIYKEAQGKFIKIAGQVVHNKNTFLHVMDSTADEYGELKIKKSASNPLLFERSSIPLVEEAPNSDSIESTTKDCPSQSQSDSCERDASGENSGSRGSSSDETSQKFSGELKSVGSAGHPDRCRECSFFFFANQGCSKGSQCRFCHEFHPRKNSRKNRRILKRLQVGDISIPEEVIGNILEPEDDTGKDPIPAALNTSTEVSGKVNAALACAEDKTTVHGSGSTPAAAVASSMPAKLPPSELMAGDSPSSAASVISLRYLRHGPDQKQAKLTVAVGQKLDLPAWVEIDSSSPRALKNMLSFTVDPPLQHGLSLDPQNGLIAGLAMDVQDRRVHVVTASTLATGPGGIKLGMVPLVRTSLLIRIVDLRKMQPTWVCEAGEDGDERILVEFKPKPALSA